MKSDVPLKAILRSGAGAHKTKRELTEEEAIEEQLSTDRETVNPSPRKSED